MIVASGKRVLSIVDDILTRHALDARAADFLDFLRARPVKFEALQTELRMPLAQILKVLWQAKKVPYADFFIF
jgi:hypothetical protein